MLDGQNPALCSFVTQCLMITYPGGALITVNFLRVKCTAGRCALISGSYRLQLAIIVYMYFNHSRTTASLSYTLPLTLLVEF